MGKKYMTKKLKRFRDLQQRHQNDTVMIQEDQFQFQQTEKQKKIVKAPKFKDTILSDIELQIIDMFSRSFSNGEIGVKFPQQKKKGMMRLMNFCFRTILEEVQTNIPLKVRQEALTSRCIDRKERTIFHLSSNYRYKHIQKSLLEDFKTVCKHYVKYHSLQHISSKFLQRFYKKVIYNEFSADTPESYKAIQGAITQVQPRDGMLDEDFVEEEPEPEIIPKKMKNPPTQPQTPKVLKKRGRKPKGYKEEQSTVSKAPKEQKLSKPSAQKTNPKTKKSKIKEDDSQKQQSISEEQNLSQDVQEMVSPQQQEAEQSGVEQQLEHVSIDPQSLEVKSNNKICIQKINIFFGYDSNSKSYKSKHDGLTEENLKKLELHPYARHELELHALYKKWTQQMQQQLIDQLMNTTAESPNIIIRNMMKKFGRNKLFVESQINEKKRQMFAVSVEKFIKAFETLSIYNQNSVKRMEYKLKQMSLAPKNYFVASFIHDFYLKEPAGISFTLVSESVKKLQEFFPQGADDNSKSPAKDQIYYVNKKKLLDKVQLKSAMNAVSQLVSNYSYDILE